MKAVLYYPKNFVDGTHVPPYSLLYPAKTLIDGGHDVVLVDARDENNSLMGVGTYDRIIETAKIAKDAGLRVTLDLTVSKVNVSNARVLFR